MGLVEEQRQSGEEKKELEIEKEGEGTEIKLFSSGGSRSLPSAKKLHKNRSDNNLALTQPRYIYL